MSVIQTTKKSDLMSSQMKRENHIFEKMKVVMLIQRRQGPLLGSIKYPLSRIKDIKSRVSTRNFFGHYAA